MSDQPATATATAAATPDIIADDAPVTPATTAAAPADDIADGIDDTPMSVGGQGKKNVSKTSFEDDSIRAYDFDLYKGRNGVTDRIGILVPGEITFGRVHYTKEAGYFLCQSEWKQSGGQEICSKVAPCCDKLDAPRKRFACLVIHYNTTPNGALVKPFSYQLKLWRFSDDRYIVLREMNKEFPLAQHDIKITCTDDTFQKMTIQACKDRVVNSDAFKKAYGADVDAWVKASMTKLDKQVGKSFAAKELLEKLGMAQAPAIVQQEAPIAAIEELLT